MAHDPFEEAGKKFQNQNLQNAASLIMASEALKELASFCEISVAKFYNGKNDVHVRRISDVQFQICFGFRPSKQMGMLEGPYAHVVVIPDGKILPDYVASSAPEVVVDHGQ